MTFHLWVYGIQACEKASHINCDQTTKQSMWAQTIPSHAKVTSQY